VDPDSIAIVQIWVWVSSEIVDRAGLAAGRQKDAVESLAIGIYRDMDVTQAFAREGRQGWTRIDVDQATRGERQSIQDTAQAPRRPERIHPVAQPRGTRRTIGEATAGDQRHNGRP
jgi:hypothetical protein